MGLAPGRLFDPRQRGADRNCMALGRLARDARKQAADAVDFVGVDQDKQAGATFPKPVEIGVVDLASRPRVEIEFAEVRAMLDSAEIVFDGLVSPDRPLIAEHPVAGARVSSRQNNTKLLRKFDSHPQPQILRKTRPSRDKTEYSTTPLPLPDVFYGKSKTRLCHNGGRVLVSVYRRVVTCCVDCFCWHFIVAAIAA